MTEPNRKAWLASDPREILLHGPSKIYLDHHWWFYPSTGIVGSYEVQAKDVHDHFGVFRGVDMIESAGQTGVSACSMLFAYIDLKSAPEVQQRFIMAFLGLGQAVFHDFVEQGETLVNVCAIHQYKFRQIRFSAVVYKAHEPAEIAPYFAHLPEDQLGVAPVPESFKKVAEFTDFIGRAINRNKI